MMANRPAGQLAAHSYSTVLSASTKRSPIRASKLIQRPRVAFAFSTSVSRYADPEPPVAKRKPPSWQGWRHPDLVVRESYREYREWLAGPGQRYKTAPENPRTNYLAARSSKRQPHSKGEADVAQLGEGGNAKAGNAEKEGQQRGGKDRPNLPFKLNPFFKSEAVLGEKMKEAIYIKVMIEQKSVREASEYFGVSMERIGAVVRMKEIERRWLAEGKPLAPFMNEAVIKMLPQTHYNPNMNPRPHESINDLPVISLTTNQQFWITSESRHFTREDAGTAFFDGLLPADQRIPHPEMVDKLRADSRLGKWKRIQAQQAANKAGVDTASSQITEKISMKNVKVHDGGKWDLRVQSVNAERGTTERSRMGVGHRYGFPHEDRKRGQIKIPTSVE